MLNYIHRRLQFSLSLSTLRFRTRSSKTQNVKSIIIFFDQSGCGVCLRFLLALQTFKSVKASRRKINRKLFNEKLFKNFSNVNVTSTNIEVTAFTQLHSVMYDNSFQLLSSLFICQLIWFSELFPSTDTYKDKYWQTMARLAFIITQMSCLLAFSKRSLSQTEW